MGQETAKHYEFTQDENKTITSAVRPMTLAALGWPLLGLCGLGAALMSQDYWVILSSVLFIVLGVSLFATARSLRSVVETEGDDVRHMMSAMRSMTNYFWVLTVVSVVLAALTVFDVLSLLS